jgi:hypothetical protein
LHTLGASADVTNWITPSDLGAEVVSHIASAVHVQLSATSLLGPAHLLGLASAGVIGLWALYRLPELGTLRALGITLLAIVLLGPTLQPWYLVWGIAILAVTNGARITSAIILLTITVSFLGVVGLGLLTSELASLGPVLCLLLIIVMAASAFAPIEMFPGSKTFPHSPSEMGTVVASSQ